MYDSVFDGYYDSELRFKDEPDMEFSIYDLEYQDDDSIPEDIGITDEQD